MEQRRRILITGCGRSGTGYISRLLSSAGLSMGHEAFGLDGISDWHLAVNDEKYEKIEKFYGCRFDFEIVLHQIRNPLSVISSAQTLNATPEVGSWYYIAKHIPCISQNDHVLVKAMKYWVFWNMFAERRAKYTYRIEDIDIELDKIAKLIGVALDTKCLETIPRNINTRGHSMVTWEQLRELDSAMCDEVIAYAKEKGYEA
jgi:hypothetical protein